MTAQEFRTLALSFAGVIEASHMNHPDFRGNGRIFATLGSPDDGHGMVKLPMDAQHAFLQMSSQTFTPAAGAWGRQGCTLVHLPSANVEQIAEALTIAFHSAFEPRAQKARVFSSLSKRK